MGEACRERADGNVRIDISVRRQGARRDEAQGGHSPTFLPPVAQSPFGSSGANTNLASVLVSLSLLIKPGCTRSGEASAGDAWQSERKERTVNPAFEISVGREVERHIVLIGRSPAVRGIVDLKQLCLEDGSQLIYRAFEGSEIGYLARTVVQRLLASSGTGEEDDG